MKLQLILNDKSLKAKAKTELIGKSLLEGSIEIGDFIQVVSVSKDAQKATCIEALEWATKSKPEIATKEVYQLVCKELQNEAPRVKWESARVIGNIVRIYPTKVDKAIPGLLANTEHTGTVVRWSAAYALGEILKLKIKYNKELLPAIEAICSREEKGSIKKMYLDVLRKVKG